MKKSQPSEAKYGLRRAGAAVLATLAIGATVKVGDAIADQINATYGGTEIAPVPADSKHKDIVFGQPYVVDGKTIVAKDLLSVAEIASVPGVNNDDEVDMLQRELEQRGIDPNTLQEGTALFVQDNAQNGTEYNPE